MESTTPVATPVAQPAPPAPAPADTAGAPEERRTAKGLNRGIVVTHGVGSQPRGEFLDDVIEPLVCYLGRCLGFENVHVEARTLEDQGRVAQVKIQVTFGKDHCETWWVREAWWAESFRPSASGTIFSWAARAGLTHLKTNFGRAFPTFGQAARRELGLLPPTGIGIWRVPTAPLVKWRGRQLALYQILNGFNLFFISLGFFLIYVVGPLILLPLIGFLLFPFRWLLPGPIGAIQTALVNFFTGGIGDQHAMTNRRIAVAAAADTIETALFPFIVPEGMPARNGRTYRGIPCETVTLIAHSGGCVVSYDALAGEVKRWFRDAPRPGRCDDSGELSPEKERRLTFISVGSGLNLAWAMRAQQKRHDVHFWDRYIGDFVNWIDVYARFDPVPQFAPPEELVHELMDEPNADIVKKRPFVSLRVANDDWPFSDHGSYWWNFEEVMPRIVHAITDSRLGYGNRDVVSALLNNDNPQERLRSYPQLVGDGQAQTPHPIAPWLIGSVEERGPQRRAAVAVRRAQSILIAIVLLALMASPIAAVLGVSLLSWKVSLFGATFSPFGWVPATFWIFGLGALRAQLAGAAAIGLIAYLSNVIWRILDSWRDWKSSDAIAPARIPEA